MSPYIVPGLKSKSKVIMHHHSDQSQKSKMTAVTDTVCEVLQVHKDKVFSKSRKREFVTARQLALFFIRRNYPYISMKSAGEFFGKRDHTTVIHSVRTVRNLVETHPPTRAIFNVIDGRL